MSHWSLFLFIVSQNISRTHPLLSLPAAIGSFGPHLSLWSCLWSSTAQSLSSFLRSSELLSLSTFSGWGFSRRILRHSIHCNFDKMFPHSSFYLHRSFCSRCLIVSNLVPCYSIILALLAWYSLQWHWVVLSNTRLCRLLLFWSGYKVKVYRWHIFFHMCMCMYFTFKILFYVYFCIKNVYKLSCIQMYQYF